MHRESEFLSETGSNIGSEQGVDQVPSEDGYSSKRGFHLKFRAHPQGGI